MAMYRNTSQEILSIFGMFRIVVALDFLSIFLTGCATAITTDTVFIGDPVELDFHVVHADLPNAMVYWRESPGFHKSALRFNPPYTDCDKVNFYVNPTKKDAKALDDNAGETTLITLEDESGERALWNKIPVSDECAVLLIVGAIKDVNFTGISASTRAGHFKRVNITFPEPAPPDSSVWPGLIVAPAFDLLFTSYYIMYYPLVTPMCPSVPDSVTVSFQFPDSTSKETVITEDRAKLLVVEEFLIPGCGNLYCSDRACVSYWVIAAMLDLRIEFRHEIKEDIEELSIEGYQGSWGYRINGGVTNSSIHQLIEHDTRLIEVTY